MQFCLVPWQIDGETMEIVTDFIFLGSKITADGNAAMKLKDAYSLEESYDRPTQHIKKQRHYFADKGPSSQSYGFSSSHAWMCELDHNNAFELWCWRRLLRVPCTARWSNQSILKEISPEYSFGRTDAEAETPILWPPDAKSWLIWKDPDAGKDWRQ